MGLAVRRVMMQQNPLPFVGGEQNDPCRFKGPAHLIARDREAGMRLTKPPRSEAGVKGQSDPASIYEVVAPT